MEGSEQLGSTPPNPNLLGDTHSRDVLISRLPPWPPRTEGLPQLHGNVFLRILGSEGVRARDGKVRKRATARTWADLAALGDRYLSSSLPVGSAMLASHSPEHLAIPPTHSKGNLARLVSINGVPQLSGGGSIRRQTHVTRRGKERNGSARGGQTNARRGVGQGQKGALSKFPTCLTSQMRPQTEFMAVSTHRALRQDPNREIATLNNSNAQNCSDETRLAPAMVRVRVVISES